METFAQLAPISGEGTQLVLKSSVQPITRGSCVRTRRVLSPSGETRRACGPGMGDIGWQPSAAAGWLCDSQAGRASGPLGQQDDDNPLPLALWSWRKDVRDAVKV